MTADLIPARAVVAIVAESVLQRPGVSAADRDAILRLVDLLDRSDLTIAELVDAFDRRLANTTDTP